MFICGVTWHNRRQVFLFFIVIPQNRIQQLHVETILLVIHLGYISIWRSKQVIVIIYSIFFSLQKLFLIVFIYLFYLRWRQENSNLFSISLFTLYLKLFFACFKVTLQLVLPVIAFITEITEMRPKFNIIIRCNQSNLGHDDLLEIEMPPDMILLVCKGSKFLVAMKAVIWLFASMWPHVSS